MSNRCGHNKNNFRHCDIVRRGKGGQPPILGVLSALAKKAAYNRSVLSAWHSMNKTARKRRSEIREAMSAVLQYLVAEWLQLDSRDCGKRMGETLKVPDAEFIAKAISKNPAWTGLQLSTWRVRAIIKQFEACGYFKLEKQRKIQRDTGEWESGPRLISFTKKLFLDLGGEKLWNAVRAIASEKISALLQTFVNQGKNARRALAKAFRPSLIRSPRQIRLHPTPTPAV